MFPLQRLVSLDQLYGTQQPYLLPPPNSPSSNGHYKIQPLLNPSTVPLSSVPLSANNSRYSTLTVPNRLTQKLQLTLAQRPTIIPPTEPPPRPIAMHEANAPIMPITTLINSSSQASKNDTEGDEFASWFPPKSTGSSITTRSQTRQNPEKKDNAFKGVVSEARSINSGISPEANDPYANFIWLKPRENRDLFLHENQHFLLQKKFEVQKGGDEHNSVTSEERATHSSAATAATDSQTEDSTANASKNAEISENPDIEEQRPTKKWKKREKTVYEGQFIITVSQQPNVIPPPLHQLQNQFKLNTSTLSGIYNDKEELDFNSTIINLGGHFKLPQTKKRKRENE